MKLGLDLDGCFADFHEGYRQALIAASGGLSLIPEGTAPVTWDYATTYGYTYEQDAEAWRRIRASTTFWRLLAPLPDADHALLRIQAWLDRHDTHEVYFLTHRAGRYAKAQSEAWLAEHGITHPTVLLAPYKPETVKGLRITHFLDDNAETCADVVAARPAARVFLRAWPYNDEIPGVTRIATLTPFLEAIGA